MRLLKGRVATAANPFGVRRPGKFIGKLIAPAAALALIWTAPAAAQSYPTQPITIICAFNAGGATDTQSRIVAEYLTRSLGQSVIVENRPGGSGGVGMGQVARATPDGYILGTTDLSPMAISPHLFTKLPFDPVKDFQPLIQLSEVDLILVVHPSIPAKSFSELVKLLKDNPNKYTYASFGQGSISHLAAESFKAMTGIKMTHVPYTGSTAAFPDVLAGRVPIMFSVAPPTIAHIKSGKMRALAVTSKKRNQALPDIPTIAESGFPDYEAVSWFAFFLPAKTPEAIVNKLNTEINEALKQPAVVEKFQSLGMTIVGGSPAHLGQLVVTEKEKWGKVFKAAGLKPLD